MVPENLITKYHHLPKVNTVSQFKIPLYSLVWQFPMFTLKSKGMLKIIKNKLSRNFPSMSLIQIQFLFLVWKCFSVTINVTYLQNQFSLILAVTCLLFYLNWNKRFIHLTGHFILWRHENLKFYWTAKTVDMPSDWLMKWSIWKR